MILPIFVFYLPARDFLTSLLQLTLSYDSRHQERNIHLFCQALRHILTG